MPTQFIYEPWLAPESVQKAAKCIVGKDYPMPMVVHTDASRINLERMRQVYKRLILKSSGKLSLFHLAKVIFYKEYNLSFLKAKNICLHFTLEYVPSLY